MKTIIKVLGLFNNNFFWLMYNNTISMHFSLFLQSVSLKAFLKSKLKLEN